MLTQDRAHSVLAQAARRGKPHIWLEAGAWYCMLPCGCGVACNAMEAAHEYARSGGGIEHGMPDPLVPPGGLTVDEWLSGTDGAGLPLPPSVH